MGLVEKFNEGGIFMYAIAVFAVLSFSLIIERYLTLFKKEIEPKQDFRTHLLGFITQGNYAEATRYAEASIGTGSAALARVAKTGVSLRASGAGDEEVQARMDEALAQEIARVDRNTGFLGMFGNVATLLGLLGTITGMIHSFAAVASANPGDRATMLSKGISEAMNCTAFGLLVAIPALIAYAVYQNKTDQFVNKLTSITTEIFHDILFLSSKRTTTQVAASQPVVSHPMN